MKKRLARFILTLAALLGGVTVFSQGVGQLPWYVSYTQSLGTVATPTFNNGTGSYSGSVAVTLSDATSGATIEYCTTSGCNPNTGSAYSSAITFSGAGTYYLNAIATKSGYTSSATIGQQTYTVTNAVTVPTYVNECNNYANYSATTCTITGVTAGHVLMIGFAGNGSATVSAVSDTNGTPVSIANQLNTVTSWNNYVYVVSNATSGSHTINVTWTGGDVIKSYLSVVEYNTNGNTSPIDTYGVGNCESSCGITLSTANFTTTQANDLLWAFSVSSPAPTVGSAPVTWASRSVATGGSGGALVEDGTAATAGSYYGQATISSGAIIAVGIKGQ